MKTIRSAYAATVAMAASAAAGPPLSSVLNTCPAPCVSTGNSPTNWTMYHSLERLASCKQTMLLDFAVYNPLNDPETSIKVFACTANSKQNAKREELAANPCQATNKTEVAMELAWSGSGNSGKASHVIAAAKQLQNRLTDDANCDMTISFGYSDKAVVGLYIGRKIESKGAAESLVQKFIYHIEQNGISNSTLAQYCGTDADYVLGIVAYTNGNLAAVQEAVKTWSDAKCVTGYEGMTNWANTPLGVSGVMVQLSNATNSKNVARGLHARATCSTYIKVVSGDSCGSLASKCGISGNQFTQYNPSSALCATLAAGQVVCCSQGDLPDLTPKPSGDGYCASYLVVSGDYCAKIAAENGLTVDKLESFNKNTWGWMGCSNIMVSMKICLSPGNPPMPAEFSNAVCGPQVPGTKKPTDGTNLADLNPCKLNACCNIWGQCGTTADFCTASKSSTGAPGTAAPGESGCISNCGTDIVDNNSPPKQFISVAYFEAWNYNRPCLHMDVSNIDKSKYTHIHFAFGDITEEFEVDVSALQNQFNTFTGMRGIKRILSFGGWSFSTEQDTYPIFREGVTGANRQTFATNVANFIKEHDLDGVDFDWEYPGAPDMPGIPRGGENDGANYLEFLKMVRSALPSGKTLSIAAPASFWYLQGFHPVKDLEPVLDYMVYMTYDLHGQWVYGNQWSSPGCPSGNCLRSHINISETTNALSMVTKAGMPANKVIVGVASYGRSFKMTESDCTGFMCTFVGPESAAAKGRCTDTAGYISNAEIYEIMDMNPSANKMYDAASDTNLLMYNNTEWVAYMDDTTKRSRTDFYKGLNFGGIADCAVDLQSMTTVTSTPPTTGTTVTPTRTTTSSFRVTSVNFTTTVAPTRTTSSSFRVTSVTFTTTVKLTRTTTSSFRVTSVIFTTTVTPTTTISSTFTPSPSTCVLTGTHYNEQAINIGVGAAITVDGGRDWLLLEFKDGLNLHVTDDDINIIGRDQTIKASDSLLEDDVVWHPEYRPFNIRACTAKYNGVTYDGIVSPTEFYSSPLYNTQTQRCNVSFPCQYAVPVNEAGYAPGVCSLHIRQYQKNDRSNPTDQYQIGLEMRDNNKLSLGSWDHQDMSQPVLLSTKLPHGLIITLSTTDDKPIVFDYGNLHWDSNSPQCKMGAYDSGDRDGDCTWQCD